MINTLLCWHYLQTQQGLHNVRHQHHYQTVSMLGCSLMPVSYTHLTLPTIYSV